MTDDHVARRHDGTSARVDRRGFLQLGLAGGLSSVVAACGWDGGNAVRPLLLDVSRLNDWVGEKILYSQHRLARQYGIAERATHVPSYFISPMMPMLRDPAAWRLQVGGLVRQPLTLSIDDLQAMPRTTYTVKHHCVEGWSAIATWHGVALSAVAERCGMLPRARYVRFDSFDSGYSNGWDLASAMHPQTILAYGMNDNPLPASHGAPLRLYSPTKLGYKMTKYLVSVTFTAERPGGYWEDQGYPWFAGV
jgi:DMSO/TMAO reductase YedYZ molybdopterin-dependent catalytic subunit